ncbi:hypothetical protein [Salinicola avicenniae]|uniref:hypothetical protein n=1 Tax=Salinicola avicenniae TaxID=2916836 RepID=UPI002073BBB9|nr:MULTISPECIES: hypothetical protein [unclassified Salinicola]
MLPRFRLYAVLLPAMLLGGCLALPQVGIMLGRIALSSLGVEDVRIGNYHFSPGLEGIDERSLLSSGLALAGLPVNLDLPLALTLPAGLPEIELQGFDWQLEVPGAESSAGQIDQLIALQGGEPVTVTLPVALHPAGSDALATQAERVSSLLSLARMLSRTGELPPGSQLSLTPALPTALAGFVTAPTLRLEIGADDETATRREPGAQTGTQADTHVGPDTDTETKIPPAAATS